jgi:hypothetical protein
MADDTADTAAPQDEDNEDYQIFQAIEDSKAQLLDNEMRRQRDRTIAVRKMQSTQQDGATQKDAEQQGGTKEKRPKPATVAPKGIPSSMVVSQAHPEEGVHSSLLRASERAAWSVSHASLSMTCFPDATFHVVYIASTAAIMSRMPYIKAGP